MSEIFMPMFEQERSYVPGTSSPADQSVIRLDPNATSPNWPRRNDL